MVNGLLSSCPNCNEKLIVARLGCDNCGLELNSHFQISKFDNLTSNDLEFIEYFLRAEGNFKTVQIGRGMSYPAVKSRKIESINIEDI